ncbi:MAG: DUF362 domain-containing protein [Clostridia bacterium]|nr:DUF362 domain-containing protein [Clostridia bacterium]
MSAKVYFSKDISSEGIVNIYKALGATLPEHVAIKLHSGERGNQNFLGPELWRGIVEHVGGRCVECNTAYSGERNTTRKHLSLLRDHGWLDAFPVAILDCVGPDLELPIPEGKKIKKNYVGRDMVNYDSLLVLSHFKGHPMGGYGGAIKQLSIGLASSYGKAYIHGSGDAQKKFKGDHDSFLESMADAAKSVIDYFEGRIVYISVMKNMSVDCDCCAVAEDPCMKDIGVLASLDPVAIDKACLDLVYASDDPGRDHLIKRIESRNGIHTIDAAVELGIGTADYELIEI